MADDPLFATLPAHMRAKPLWQMLHINQRLSDHYDEDELALWWHRGHPQLDGESAIVALLSDRFDEVLQIVNRLDSAVYL